MHAGLHDAPGGQGKLSNKFKKPFRRRKPWVIDWAAQQGKEADAGELGAD